MSEKLEKEISEYYDSHDFAFENIVVWGVEKSTGSYNYSSDEKTEIDWESAPAGPLKEEPPKVPLSEREIQEQLQSLEKKEVPPETKLDQDSLNLPPQRAKQQAYLLRRRSKFRDLLKLRFFKDKESKDLDTPVNSQDFIEEQHKMMEKEQKDSKSMDYNIKDFPLAEPELINKLCEEHMVFFNLLSKLQETHTPTDFTTAFHIQDRIAYLIDNQTLLYRTLTRKLIKYLQRINEKLKKYHDEITLKQEDLKKINAQIARFNEYDRKTQTRINQAAKETKWFKEDVKTYQEHLGGFSPDQETRVEKKD